MAGSISRMYSDFPDRIAISLRSPDRLFCQEDFIGQLYTRCGGQHGPYRVGHRGVGHRGGAGYRGGAGHIGGGHGSAGYRGADQRGAGHKGAGYIGAGHRGACYGVAGQKSAGLDSGAETTVGE